MKGYKKLVFDGVVFHLPIQCEYYWFGDEEHFPSLKSPVAPTADNDPFGIHFVLGADDPRLDLYEGELVEIEVWGSTVIYKNGSAALSGRAECARVIRVRTAEGWTEAVAPKRGIELKGDHSNADLIGAYLFGVSLDGVDLSGADLSGADLRYALIDSAPRARFVRANAMRSQLRGSFSESCWDDADLKESDICLAQFFDGKLARVNLERANIAHSKMSNVILEGANLNGGIILHSTFLNCDMRGVDFSNAEIRGSFFDNVNLVGANFHGADLRGSAFIDCLLDQNIDAIIIDSEEPVDIHSVKAIILRKRQKWQ